MSSELKQRAVKGLGWLGVGQVASQTMSLCITGVLARLLLPEAFGLVGMAAVFTALLEQFQGLGLGPAVIQRRNLTEEQLSTVFVISVLLGAALAGLTALAAPYIAAFYSRPELSAVAALIGLRFFICSFVRVHAALLRRRLQFRRLVVIQIISRLVGGAAGIALALAGFGVYALVAQGLAHEMLFSTSLWVTGQWRPRARPRLRSVGEMVRFGGNVTGAGILGYVSRNADYLLIGRFLGAGALGIYTLAYRIMLLPLRRVTMQLSRVVFPAFAAIQHDAGRVRRGFLQLLEFTALVTFPAMAGLLLVVPEAVPVALGAKWTRAVFLVQVLALTGALQSVSLPAVHVLRAQGRADLDFRFRIVATLARVAAFLVGLRWHIEGVAVCYTAVELVINPARLYLVSGVIRLSFRDLYRALRGPTWATVVMAVAVAGWRTWAVQWEMMSPLWLLLSEVGVGMVVYAAALKLTAPGIYGEGIGLFQLLIRRTGRKGEAGEKAAHAPSGK